LRPSYVSETRKDEAPSPTLTHSIPLELERDLLQAACIGAAPSLFDANGYPSAYDGIKVCAHCPRDTKWACLQKIEPHKTWFDGVAGGIVWRNGIVQTVTGKTLHLTDKTLVDYFDERYPKQNEMEDD
jgi:WhiB family redox-sensing transcriptional regulator